MELLSVEELIDGYERERERMDKAIEGVLKELNGISRKGG